MPESDSEIIERLTKTLKTLVPMAFGDGFKLSPISPQRFFRRYSFVFRYWMEDSDGNLQPLFLKIPLPAEIKTLHDAIRFERVRSEIKNEFEIMQTIAGVISKAQHPGLFAIKPGACILEFNAILMEEVALSMVKNYLGKWGILFGRSKDWEEFTAVLKLAGDWLKLIHGEFQNGRFATLEDLGMEEVLNRKFVALENLIGYKLVEERKLFFKIYNQNRAVQIPISSLHHDFHLGNIFTTPDGRVGVLDPNWKENGPIFEDLASVLIDPLSRKNQVISLGLLFRSALAEKYEKAILHGYFGERFTRPCMLYFYCALALLEKWRGNEELLKNINFLPRTLAGSILSKPTRYYFSHLVKTYLFRELEISTGNYH